MEADETPTHVMLECTGVTEQRKIYLGSSATIPEVLSTWAVFWDSRTSLHGWSSEQQWEISRAETAQREEEEAFTFTITKPYIRTIPLHSLENISHIPSLANNSPPSLFFA
ncbi:jg16782 [Pararge aegeria aegeria]|uniref:Jg16782 protein n=1 Tax=Pararge aegeria aegeria TaxID=348720 RepID=A0A8S4RY00_9NEOP|nr:jg16782 [Pararge aegeria aegeria]